jgi:hypothetical protein
MNARDRIEVPTTSWKLSRLNLYRGNGANEKRRVGVGEKLAGQTARLDARRAMVEAGRTNDFLEPRTWRRGTS